MIGTDARSPVESLALAAGDGRVHTVRVCFADHYGVLRGRRIAAERFVAGASAPQAFCDGALVWDIRCDIFEEVDFSNYRTGYPDLYIRPDLATLRPCGWTTGEHAVLGDAYDAHGAPLEVAPRWVLRRVAERVGRRVPVLARLELRVPDDAVAAEWAPGRPAPFGERLLEGLRAANLPVLSLEWSRPRRVLAMSLEGDDAVAVADALVIARTAAREVAAAEHVRLTAMPRLGTGDAPTALRLEVAAREGADAEAVRARTADLELLLRPLPVAYAGVAPAGPLRDGHAQALAASDANPYLAIAATLAAAWEPAGAPTGAQGSSFRGAIARLRAARWTGAWFAPLFLHDALALAEREADLRDAAVSDWDLGRYWECG